MFHQTLVPMKRYVFLFLPSLLLPNSQTVSYTHLDVYKRQVLNRLTTLQNQYGLFRTANLEGVSKDGQASFVSGLNNYWFIAKQPDPDVYKRQELIYSDPRQLSLNEMFRVAQTMEPGSDAYREVFEIAVRMYPDDPVSNLNAALTAIDVGRLESAHRYLAKTSDSAERTLAEAAIAMLENRLDEAEALLGKLSDDPSVASQVEENLRQIAAKREELAD